jgi:hypothetical protein
VDLLNQVFTGTELDFEYRTDQRKELDASQTGRMKIHDLLTEVTDKGDDPSVDDLLLQLREESASARAPARLLSNHIRN